MKINEIEHTDDYRSLSGYHNRVPTISKLHKAIKILKGGYMLTQERWGRGHNKIKNKFYQPELNKIIYNYNNDIMPQSLNRGGYITTYEIANELRNHPRIKYFDEGSEIHMLWDNVYNNIEEFATHEE